MKAEFERAVALDPESIRARTALVGYYLEAPSIAGGDVEKAKQQAMEIKKRDSLEGCSQLAMIYTHLEEWAQVEAIWDEAAKSHPESAEPLVGLGLLYQNRKQWDRAFSAVRRPGRHRAPGERQLSHGDRRRHAEQVQQSNGVLGVSPFSCGYITNSISYTFANLARATSPSCAGRSRKRPRTRGASTTSTTTAIR